MHARCLGELREQAQDRLGELRADARIDEDVGQGGAAS
jgi:hypothetical protein